MKNPFEEHNLVAFSANAAEIALNTEQTLDTTFHVGQGKLIRLIPRLEDNANENTGKEEPDTTYKMPYRSEASLEPVRPTAQHFGFFYAFGLGLDTPAAWGTGYKHIITPLVSRYMPSMTGANRVGQTIFKRRFGGLFMDTVSANFTKGSWAKISGGVKGTGKFTDSVTKETVNAAYNAASLTLAANVVQGTTAAERLDSIHNVRVKVPTTGEWADVVVTAVSDAEPAVLTITPPGGAVTLCDYEILYAPEEAAWATFPARITEPPLFVANMIVNVGGKWNGTTLLGGHNIANELKSIDHTLNNNMSIEDRPDGNGLYANYGIRNNRVQKLKLNREAKDFLLEQRLLDNEDITVYVECIGAEWATGYNYYFKLLCPQCTLLTKPFEQDGKFIAEVGDLLVKQDSTYGSVRVEVANRVAAYAAAA